MATKKPTKTPAAKKAAGKKPAGKKGVAKFVPIRVPLVGNIPLEVIRDAVKKVRETELAEKQSEPGS